MTASPTSLPADATSAEDARPGLPPRVFLGLTLGSAGVVYGDIGTSPLYAFKESIAHLRGPGGALATADVLGVVSLMFWALMIVVTLKYVLVLLRFDNRGEGGNLALMALVQRAGGRGATAVVLIGMLGAGLFFGDAMLTPAVSVLSAVEGLRTVDALSGRIDPFITPIALALLVALFMVQRHGTAGIGRWFGVICVVWFLTLATLGVIHIVQAPQVLGAFDPAAAISVLARHPGLALIILGSVFLTVTGAEALYADMGHFGRGPIQAAWLGLVFPCLTLNYLGQGALVLGDPRAAASPFFLMAPEWFQLPLVLLATAATIIASQAVISGAFSLAQAAVQLGLLPRLTFRPTSEHHVGQIYAPQINWLLMAGVAMLVLAFGSSSALASAYGVSVVGAMITSTVLAVVAVHRLKRRPIAVSLLMFAPLLAVEGAFLLANLLKIPEGGWMPLALAVILIGIMGAWRTGAAKLARAEAREVGLSDVLSMLQDHPPMRARGSAVFLSADPAAAPAALLHNLKHNQVLHEQVVLLTIEAVRRPRLVDAERVTVTEVAPGVKSVVVRFGFMERPNVAKGLALARSQGLTLDLMSTSFFLSRRTVLVRSRGFTRLRDRTFTLLLQTQVRAAEFFQIPPSRVVELGVQVVL